MNRLILTLLLCILSVNAFPQQGQLNISRIDQMPDLPAPLLLRDWNAVAHDYDNFVFNLNKTGEYLPLSRIGTQGQFNYADNTPLFLDSYVGSDDHLNQAEAINLIPSIIGATLSGIDKSNQNGTNWVAMTKDFFNLENGQNVYLNSYSTTSGDDWWYDVMPNIFFYQLKSLYPDAAPEFNSQFTTVADRWLFCVNRLGGSTSPWSAPSMNYRAFDLATGLPLTTGVKEPEAAGSIAWLLYNAYLETGKREYFEGAQLAMEFLTGFESNPSYELQLAYGTLTAARMNAVENTNYPIQKMLDWCFNRGDLRGWGAIIGTWGGYDVSGLIGEANDAGNDYAFVMNGFQQAAALAPLPKYDKRYARAIAKWLLNVSNASRLFYRDALPQINQDSFTWSLTNDPTACIPHESIKQIFNGIAPYATGDAISGDWATTNLSLYSGSSVGYLAAVSQTTNIPEILQIDLNKTDFYGDNSLASYLYFNPTLTTKLVDFTLPSGSYGVYDAITENILFTVASGSVQITVPSGEVRLIRLYSSALTPDARDGMLYAGNDVLDYHFNYDYSDSLRIKSLSTDNTTIAVNSVFSVYCTPGNIITGDIVEYNWYLNDVLIEGETQPQIQLTAPSTPSQPLLKCMISTNGQSAVDTLQLHIVEYIPTLPVVKSIQSDSKYVFTGGVNTFTAIVEPAVGETLEYLWSASAGTLNQTEGNSVTWQATEIAAVATFTVKVTNQYQLSTTISAGALVKKPDIAVQTPLIWYPFDYDNRNSSSNRFHATATGVTKTDDARQMASLAYRFTDGSNIIYTDNHDDLNFSNAVTLSCWVKCEQLGSERFIISHGSWQQRYKLSITPEGLFRWTVKTSSGTTDLDCSSPLELNRYYHVTAIYTGYSVELYINGSLDTFKACSGLLQPSTKPLTIGRMDNTETLYALRGSIDEVKLWDKEIPISQIEGLMNQWLTSVRTVDDDIPINIYPIPSEEVINIEFGEPVNVRSVFILNSNGNEMSGYQVNINSSGITVSLPQTFKGLYFIRIILKNGRVITRKIIVT